MCDFRNITKIRLLGSDEIIDVTNKIKKITYIEYNSPDKLEEGLYFVIASGSFYAYYDGNSCKHEEDKIWETIEWEERGYDLF